MHLSPGVVRNFPKRQWCIYAVSYLCIDRVQILIHDSNACEQMDASCIVRSSMKITYYPG